MHGVATLYEQASNDSCMKQVNAECRTFDSPVTSKTTKKNLALPSAVVVVVVVEEAEVVGGVIVLVTVRQHRDLYIEYCEADWWL
jgi:hypothetical protein